MHWTAGLLGGGSIKKVVGDRIITLLLEMNFSLYMGTTANPLLEMPEFSTKSTMGHLFS